jgi:transaldolase
MTLYLDSAFLEDAQTAFSLGIVKGITTNPALLAKTGRPPSEVISALCKVATGTVFHQLAADEVEGRYQEGKRMLAIAPGQIGLKIPCTLENLDLAARFVKEGHVVGVTAIFSPAQVALAIQTGAQYILPYVNRSTRLLGDGPNLVREMRAVIDASGSKMEIVAASIKTPEEATATLLAGAHHLTLPLTVIEAMAHHPLSIQAIEDFNKAAQGD